MEMGLQPHLERKCSDGCAVSRTAYPPYACAYCRYADWAGINIGRYRISGTIAENTEIIPFFREYLQSGYLPVRGNMKPALYPVYLYNLLSDILYKDLRGAGILTTNAMFNLRRVLSLLAQKAHFKPNISSLARDTGAGSVTVIEFMELLEHAGVINFLLMRQ